MSVFFHDSGKTDNLREQSFTLLRVPDETVEGGCKTICLELQENPCAALSFTDFSISECLKHGVDLHSIAINPDYRLGHDAEFDAFSDRLRNISDSLFKTE